jgi:hypothetical protein
VSLIALNKAKRPPLSLRRNIYLTDGVSLFRVEGTIDDPARNGWALLEDCLTLHSDFYTADQLAGMGLDLVRPA